MIVPGFASFMHFCPLAFVKNVDEEFTQEVLTIVHSTGDLDVIITNRHGKVFAATHIGRLRMTFFNTLPFELA